MMKKSFWILAALFVLVGCAQVQVQAPKDPIKMDISMRLDVYQHVVKDVDEFEDLVSGSSPNPVTSFFITNAYADDEAMTPEARDAALRRRDRHSELSALESQGVLGEGRNALVTVRQAGNARAEQVMNAENSDRMVIFRAIAAKRGSSLEDVQKVYAERLRNRLPGGTPVENPDGSWTTA